MKTILKKMAVTAIAALSLSTAAQEAEVFIYSPGQGAGLRIAQKQQNGWHDMGQLCSSDYGTWGAEKKMYAPSVCRAKDGSWRLVFQVNDHSPVFAAAYSKKIEHMSIKGFFSSTIKNFLLLNKPHHF